MTQFYKLKMPSDERKNKDKFLCHNKKSGKVNYGEKTISSSKTVKVLWHLGF